MASRQKEKFGWGKLLFLLSVSPASSEVCFAGRASPIQRLLRALQLICTALSKRCFGRLLGSFPDASKFSPLLHTLSSFPPRRGRSTVDECRLVYQLSARSPNVCRMTSFWSWSSRPTSKRRLRFHCTDALFNFFSLWSLAGQHPAS